MSTIGTVVRLSRVARKGVRWRDKWLAFLVAGVGVLGPHRKKLRPWFVRRIDRLARDGSVDLHVWCNGRPLVFSMRLGDEDDYKIGGELVRGPYRLPDATPRQILDGGANIGMFALFAAAHFPGAAITCYEPGPENFRRLVANLKRNDVTADARQAGLWSADTTLYFQASTSYAGTVSAEASGTAVRCEVPRVGPDCWAKIDIEGAEYEVLPELFRRGTYPRWISMEVHDFANRGGQLLALMRAHGYSVDGGDDPTAGAAVIFAFRRP